MQELDVFVLVVLVATPVLVGTNLQTATSLAVGAQGLGFCGILLLDNIALYR